MDVNTDTIELFLFGFAAMVDVALWMVIVQPINRGRVAVWLKTLVAATTLVHAAIFFRLMIVDVPAAPLAVLDRLLVIAICGGLLTLPSAMLHAGLRLHRTRLVADPPRDARYAWLYLPIAVLPAITWRVWRSEGDDFLVYVGPWKAVFLAWLVVANGTSIGLFWKLRTLGLVTKGHEFLRWLSIAIALMTCLAIGYAFFATGTLYELPLRLMTTLSPLAVALLFVWYSLRERMLTLVMERTFGYAVIAVSLLLLHGLVITPAVGWLGRRANVDFAWIEGILIAAIVLSIPSLRSRVGESLRYLFSTNMHEVRDAMRQLALRLAQNASQDRDELLDWFTRELQQSIGLEHVTIVTDADTDCALTTSTSHYHDRENPPEPGVSDSLRWIHQSVSDEDRVRERGTTRSPQLEHAFEVENALLAIRFSYRSIHGTVVLGNRLRNDRLTREQIVVLSLIIDQFAAILHNRLEVQLRQQTQRKLLQQEKLSVLGLLAGSLAHELRNPLSSMRTITTLVMEELGEKHECWAELEMVVGEIDRLSRTTNRLLDYAKPEGESECRVAPDAMIRRIMSILDYLAMQLHVQTTVELNCQEAWITAEEASFSEIIFNLIKNAIEAAQEVEEGRVLIRSTLHVDRVIVSVCDNGPGIPDDRKTHIYEPFVTGKSEGNGLGLFAVAERVRELGGRIEHRGNQPCGTVFEFSLPLAQALQEIA